MSDQGKSSLHKLSSVFHDLHLGEDFCNAVIKVEDVEFQIQKGILRTCSPNLRALFRHWSALDKKVFDMPCCVFLEEQLRPENCISIWQFTNICFSEALQHKAYSLIIDHFENVVSCEEFLQLSVQELANILDKDDLNVRKESTVFEAILHWITHDHEERKGHIAVLLSKVRLALMSTEYIRRKVMSNELVVNSAECQQMLKDAIQTKCNMVTNRPSASALSNTVARPRLPNAILLAIGGLSDSELTNTIEAYDVRADCWINVTNRLERPRASHGTAFLNGYVYCVGGLDGVELSNSVVRLDLSTLTWHEVAPMCCCRCCVSVTVLDGCIYAMGGYDGYTQLSTAERYKPETNQWSLVAPMHEQRSDASCTTLHNKVYICGGFNANERLQTCECYSPEANQWTMIAPMNTRRIGLGVIASADHVYAVGGFDDSALLRSAEAYNPQTNTWHAVSSMFTPRSHFGIEVIDNQLFAVGGFSGFTTSCNVEYYDATTDKWSEACDMAMPHRGLSCCVVPKNPQYGQVHSPR